DEGMDDYAMSLLDLERKQWDTGWRDTVTQEREGRVEIALAGKYDFEDAYLSVYEALKHAGLEHNVETEVLWVDSDEMEEKDKQNLMQADGLIVPGGFGERGTEGKIEAVRYARDNDVPFLGLCFGFQMAVVEYARNVADIEDAHSAEIREDAENPVIDLLPEQYDLEDLGGTMRLGDKTTVIEEGTQAHRLYGKNEVSERHRHRFEVNPDYIDELEGAGMKFSGRSESGTRMEILEHPYFIGTQFHPEFKSRPRTPSPPFVGLVEAAMDYKDKDRENAEEVETGEIEVDQD
ncbi:MAG: CTP synthase, partial [Halobacteria archaeon]|nr:CTP synthase [Halobacteria archaeon]